MQFPFQFLYLLQHLKFKCLILLSSLNFSLSNTCTQSYIYYSTDIVNKRLLFILLYVLTLRDFVFPDFSFSTYLDKIFHALLLYHNCINISSVLITQNQFINSSFPGNCKQFQPTKVRFLPGLLYKIIIFLVIAPSSHQKSCHT